MTLRKSRGPCNNQSQRNFTPMKFWHLAVFLLLLTPVMWVGAILFHPKAKVGVVLVDDCRAEIGEVVAKGFAQHYGKYFHAEVLPQRFDAFKVRTKSGIYLNSDFFRMGNAAQLKRQSQVNIILFITAHPINDWDEGGGGGVWGQADTKTGSALMTVKYWMKLPHGHLRMQVLGLHEVMHLLGYVHNPWDNSGIMQYAANIEAKRLCSFYEAQLPVRIMIYKWGFGHSFNTAVMITAFGFSFVLLPFFIAVELILVRIFSGHKESRDPTKLMIFSNIVLAVALSMWMNGAWYLLTVPLALMLFFHLVHYGYFYWVKNRVKALS